MKAVSTVILDVPHDSHTSLGELQEKLSRLKGVSRVTLNPVTQKVTVDFNPSKSTLDKIRAAVAANKNESEDSCK